MIKHIGTQPIETERLILRRHEMRDAEDMFRNWVTDPAASRFWSWEPHKDIGETRDLLRGWIEEYENPACYHWIITQKDNGEAIGYIYLRVDESDCASVHYLLSPKLWNRGIMTEACRAVLAYGFEKVGFLRIHSMCHAENAASGRVLEKVGMRGIGDEFRSISECPRISGEYILYEMMPWEWFSLHSETARWMGRNARPLDYARYLYHFRGGSIEDVLDALLAYQNPDGGFGHALEADSWNPDSSPIQTWAATEILREIGFADATHPIIRGIMRYLASGADFDGCRWTSAVPGNNDYPHAPWWTYKPDSNYGYNPTACLAGFLIRFAPNGGPAYALGLRVAGEAAQAYLSGESVCGHLSLCYVRMLQYTQEAGGKAAFDCVAVEKKLTCDIVKEYGEADLDWSSDGVLLEFIKTGIGLDEKPQLPGRVKEYMLSHRQSDGTWNIPWKWGEYPDDWPVAKNWWKGYGVIVNLLYLKHFDTTFKRRKSNETGR